METIKEAIRQEHREAELLRLRAGLDGCGCADCQELYRDLDLGKYGARVKRNGASIVIDGGKAGADLWAQYNKADVWREDGYFVTGGHKFGISPKGKTTCYAEGATPERRTTMRASIEASPNGVILINGQDASIFFSVAVAKKTSPYLLAKKLKEQCIVISARTAGRLLAGQQSMAVS